MTARETRPAPDTQNPPDAARIARAIDHAVLSPAATADQLRAGCELAGRCGVASVCLLPYAVPLAASVLKGTETAVCTVVGFPGGANATPVKALEAQRAVLDGATEIDMVANVSAALSGDFARVHGDIAAVLDPVHSSGNRLKVILECATIRAALGDTLGDQPAPDTDEGKAARAAADDLIARLCQICGDLRVDWVKTSTGFGPGGATHHDVALLRKSSPEHVQVKASGGIKNAEHAAAYLALGATRLGTSSTEAILTGLTGNAAY